MRSGFLRNLSASALQLLLNQALAFLLFLLLSAHLAKEDFGRLNWCLAVLLLLFSVLSFGFDQLLVQKIAAGEAEETLLGPALLHQILGALLAVAAAAMAATSGLVAPAMAGMLLLLTAGKGLLALSLPVKSRAAGAERFSRLLQLSLPASLIKAVGALALVAGHRLTLTNVVVLFAVADAAEGLLSLVRIGRRSFARVRLRQVIPAYRSLLRQSLPQLGVLLFGSALARFDQVLLGWLRPPAQLAEYWFAVKFYELASLPLLVIGPLLLPRLTRRGAADSALVPLLRLELAVAFASVLLLNLGWSPLIDGLTQGRYGAVNRGVIFWLSLCLPLLYLNNVFWTAAFTAGRQRAIFRLVALSFAVNAPACLLLIPRFGPQGAAASLFLALALQTVGYRRLSRLPGLAPVWRCFAICAASVLLLLVAVPLLPGNPYALALLGFGTFLVLLAASGELGREPIRFLRQLIRS